MTGEESEFEVRLRTMLEDSAEGLDGRIRSRLTQARFAALEARRSAPRVAWRNWAPAGAIAASALLAVVLFSNHGGTALHPGMPVRVAAVETPNALDDIELLADNDAIELANSDEYEFYEWAASEEPAGGTGLGS